jgi:hypothetical protein
VFAAVETQTARLHLWTVATDTAVQDGTDLLSKVDWVCTGSRSDG